MTSDRLRGDVPELRKSLLLLCTANTPAKAATDACLRSDYYQLMLTENVSAIDAEERLLASADVIYSILLVLTDHRV